MKQLIFTIIMLITLTGCAMDEVEKAIARCNAQGLITAEDLTCVKPEFYKE